MNCKYQHIKYLFFIVLFLGALKTNAQQLTVKVDKPLIKIGEQFSLKLKLDNANTASVSALWNVADTFNTFEIVEAAKIDSASDKFTQEFLVTSFDSGMHTIPQFTVMLKNGRQLRSDSIIINVTNVDVSQMKDYNDIKDVLAPAEPKITWWLLLTVVSIVFALMITMYIIFSRKNKKPVKQKVNINLLDETIKRLAVLQQQQYFSGHQHKKYFTELTDLMHVFIDETSGKNTKQLTTAEWMVQLKNFKVNKPTEVAFFQLLRLSDAVKFAKYIPDNIVENEAIATAANFAKALWQLRYNKTFA